jgi:hypothetical protein
MKFLGQRLISVTVGKTLWAVCLKRGQVRSSGKHPLSCALIR